MLCVNLWPVWIWTLRRTAGAIASCPRGVREHLIYGWSQASRACVCVSVRGFVCLFCSVELFCKKQQHVGVYRPSCQLHSQVYGSAWFKTPYSLRGGWRQWDDKEGFLEQMFAAVCCFECFFAEGRCCSEKRKRSVCGLSQSRGEGSSCCGTDDVWSFSLPLGVQARWLLRKRGTWMVTLGEMGSVQVSFIFDLSWGFSWEGSDGLERSTCF